MKIQITLTHKSTKNKKLRVTLVMLKSLKNDQPSRNKSRGKYRPEEGVEY